MSAPKRSLAPCAIASAVSADTLPCCIIVCFGTPSSASFEALL
jgi:hypothetical protein